jgi:hypothetical protein
VVSEYLPVKEVISIMENEPRLRIPRTQAMGMISMSDCYDPTGKLIHYEPFAEYASDVLTIMRSDEGIDSHTKAIQSVSFDEAANDATGATVTEETLTTYFVQEFAPEKEQGLTTVAREKFLRVLHGMPGAALSEKEVLTIAAIAIHDQEGNEYDWADFITWAHGAIHSLSRERLVLYRGTSEMSFQVKNKQRLMVKRKELAELAKKLLTQVRLKLTEATKSLTLVLPWEAATARKKSVDFEATNGGGGSVRWERGTKRCRARRDLIRKGWCW